MSYILSIDQGTTGSTAALIDAKTFKFVGKVNHEFTQIYPRPSWVEHNLNEIWDTTKLAIKDVLKKNNISGDEINSIGITNQRETTCAYNKKGEPLGNAIVWQDRRTESFCNQLKKDGKEDEIKSFTGLPIDAYFSATKMNWLLGNNEKVQKNAKEGNLLFSTIETFLLYKLTSGDTFATEPSNASRTLLFDIHRGDWSPDLCELFGLRKEFLPEVKDSFGEFGKTRGLSFLPDDIPIAGILGDQQAALFGQACYAEGEAKCTYGTGSFMLVNTGNRAQTSENGLLTTVAYRHKNELYYALEGSCYIAGAAVQWLRDNLGLFNDSPEIETLAKQIGSLDEMENLLFLPFFTGLGSPYWISEAKGAILGLTRDSDKRHLSRSCLDGIALSINDLFEAMKQDLGGQVESLKVDGGAVENDLLMEIQATVSDTQIVRPEVIETTAYGAALASAVGSETINFDQIPELWREDRVFKPVDKNIEFYGRKKTQWKDAIKRLYLT